jgi:DNA-binding CsgD family transcriptional regulator
MRVVLVGAPRDRQRLRTRLDGAVEVVGEFATLSAARSAGVAFDAILFPPDRPRRPDDTDDEDGEPGEGIETLEDNHTGETLEALEALTAREIQVLELLAEGLSNKAIAARLGISDQTVKFHVASVSGKLGAANRTDAVRRAVRRGLIAL